MKDYVWGSDSTKSNISVTFADVLVHKLDAASGADMTRAASRYVHYVHGTNLLSLVYLTNMYAHGAENCANECFRPGSLTAARCGIASGLRCTGRRPAI